MITISNDHKNAYETSTKQVDKIIVDNQEYFIDNVEYYDDCYDEGNIFGTAISRCLDFEIENNVNLENKELTYLTGIDVNGTLNWINLGTFIVQTVEPNDTTNINKVVAMDYMLKSNIPYESNLSYDNGNVTIADVIQEVCTNCGIGLATTEFPNSGFIVDSNQFAEGTLCRQVIQAVAQISGTVAKVKSDGNLYFIGHNTEVKKVIGLSNYVEMELKRNTHPLNVITLGVTDINGENVTMRDEESIAELGEENALVINDNPFAYTQSKRQQLITALYNATRRFTYKAYSMKCQGLPYMESMDKIQITDIDGQTYDSYIFRFNYHSPKGLESTIEAPSIIKATVDYQNIADAIEIAKRTEIMVDKQNQTITSVVSNVTEQNEKISEIDQTVAELNSKISDIADITTSGESSYATVNLTDVNQSEPIYIQVRPIDAQNNISYWYPHSNLYPSADLFLKVRTLRFYNTETEETFDYVLPNDLLYYNATIYDEFILSYDQQICQVIKRCKYNADGTVSPLETPTTIDYPYPTIELTDGDYQISLLGYNTAYLQVKLMAKNIYTTQFYTKSETNSLVSQTAGNITAEVNQRLTNYSTTNEMNSAISVSANAITSSVNNKFMDYSTTTQMNSAINQTASTITTEVGTKVGKNEVISRINQSSEAVTILANKLGLTANDVINIISNNTLNLTAKNIGISSTNFNVDKNGNLTCTNANVKGKIESNDATITGGSITLDTTGGIQAIKVRKNNSNSTMSYITPDVIAINNNGNNLELANFSGYPQIDLNNGSTSTHIYYNRIVTPTLTQTSKESLKKNIKKYDANATNIIKNSQLYTYNFKSEDDKDKKHIGFVIGDEGGDYSTPEEVISADKEGINGYDMTSILWKAVQEQQETIETLQKEFELLKGGKINE